MYYFKQSIIQNKYVYVSKTESFYDTENCTYRHTHTHTHTYTSTQTHTYIYIERESSYEEMHTHKHTNRYIYTFSMQDISMLLWLQMDFNMALYHNTSRKK